MRKLLIFLLIPLCAVFLRYGEASAFPKSDQECIKCHTLSADQAKEVFNELIPGLKILGIQDSPLKGLWEVSMEAGGKKGILYIDYSKKKLIAGSLVDIKTKVNHTQESFSKLNTADISQIPLDNALVMGDKNAKHKVVVFDDPDWPYCVKLHQEMKKVIEKRKDIAFYIIMYPLPMHKEAYEKSKTIVCEKSLAVLEDALDKKPLPKAKCETTVVDDNIKLAEKLGISGTPAIILPDGVIIPGYRDADALINLIDKK